MAHDASSGFLGYSFDKVVEKRASSIIIERGKKYHEATRYAIKTDHKKMFLAKILGTKLYTTKLSIIESIYPGFNYNLIGNCSCPYFESNEICKHVSALSHIAKNSKLEQTFLELRGQIKYLSLYEWQEFNEYGNLTDDYENEDECQKQFQTNIDPTPTWKKNLNQLKTQISPPVSPTSIYQKKDIPKTRDIYYEVSQDQYFYTYDSKPTDSALKIKILHREKLKSGKMSKLKPFKFNGLDVEEKIINSDDLRIVKELLNYNAEEYNYRYGNSKKQDSAVILKHLRKRLLKEISNTGRLIFTSFPIKNQETTYNLTWDDKTSITLKMGVELINDTWKIFPLLKRSDSIIRLDDLEYLNNNSYYRSETSVLTCKENSKVIAIIPHSSLIILNSGLHPLDPTAIITEYSSNGLAQMLEHFISNSSIELPKENLSDLISFLNENIGISRVEFLTELNLKDKDVNNSSNNHIQLSPISPEKYFNLTINQSSGKNGALEIFGTPEFVYTPNQKLDEQTFQFDNYDEENLHINELQNSELLDFVSDITFNIASDKLEETVKSLSDSKWIVRAHNKQIKSASSFSSSVSASGEDWFDLKSNMTFGKIPMSIPQILKAAKNNNNGRFITLGDGSFGLLPDKWLEKYAALAELGEIKNDTIRFSKAQALLLDSLLEESETTLDEKLYEHINQIKKFKAVKKVSPSKKFNGTLRPYQVDGLTWLNFLTEIKIGGCLADDMGLGKTVQVLAFLQKFYTKKGKKKQAPTLLVVPKSLVYNWVNECHKFTPDLNIIAFEGSKGERKQISDNISKYHILVTTYGILRKDILKLKEIFFDNIILDEAQAIKNEKSLTAKSAYLLNGTNRFALTGTPVENHLNDLFSIFKFLIPSFFRKQLSSSTFTEDQDGRFFVLNGIRPFILRRKKEEVLDDLPEKVEDVIYCELGSKQKKTYNELRDYYKEQLTGKIDLLGVKKSKMHVLEALLRLRQMACHPDLITFAKNKENTGQGQESAKLEYLIEQLTNIISGGHKVLVFSQFTTLLKIVAEELKKCNMKFEYLDGSTTNREKVVNNFKNDHSCKVFLISLKAGGHGLNLTEADYCFILDPWWNPAVESQAIDRIHRIGQQKKVFAYKLISKDTVEEKILNIQAAKKDMASDILSSNGSFIKNLTQKDINYLFT